VDIVVKKIEINRQTGEDKCIGSQTCPNLKFFKMPIMVRSKYCSLKPIYSAQERVNNGECEYDQGGYFIINGGEKVIVAQERMATNFVYCYQKKMVSQYSWEAEVRSFLEGVSEKPKCFTIRLFNEKKRKDKGLRCRLPYLKEDIPLIILFRALGFVEDKIILELICHDLEDPQMIDLLRPTFSEFKRGENEADLSPDIALNYIGKRTNLAHGSELQKRINHGRQLLEKMLLPHLGIHDSNKKGFFIAYMVNRLLSAVLHRATEDDRDHYGKKRLELVGMLMCDLFRQKFKNFKKEFQKKFSESMFEKRKNMYLEELMTKSRELTNGMTYALATGNWGNKHINMKCGVAQVLNRQNFFATLSHCRRVNQPISKQRKCAKPRQLHSTHWGMICPSETPEGQSCGLIKNLALMAVVSVGETTEELDEILDNLGMENLSELNASNVIGKTKVFVNGCWMGIHGEPQKLLKQLKGCKRSGIIPREVSIVRDFINKEIKIYTDAGRVQRTLFIVEDNKLLIKKSHIAELDKHDFEWLIKQGYIEFLDVEEEETSFIALNFQCLEEAQKKCYNYTHCEINSCMILGVCASIIPFSDHNQSPRNTYQSGMGKQAMGVYATNYNARMDTLSYVLYYPQKPLCCTRSMDFMHFSDLPSGINAITAIACFTGYNQEDSIIMNQSSIDRGLFRSIFFRTYKSEQNKLKGEEFCQPSSNTKELRISKYNKIDIDGFAKPGTRVYGNDIIIGKQVKEEGEDRPQDISIGLRESENGMIDNVMISTDKEGYKFVKVKTRSVRRPQIGDKFAR